MWHFTTRNENKCTHTSPCELLLNVITFSVNYLSLIYNHLLSFEQKRKLIKPTTSFHLLYVELLCYYLLRQVLDEIFTQIAYDEQSIESLPRKYVTKKKIWRVLDTLCFEHIFTQSP